MKNQKKKTKVIFIVLNVIMALWYLAPMYWAFITSIKERLEIFATPPTIIPKSFTLKNYIHIFTIKDGQYTGYLFNSVVITLFTVLLVCIISMAAGFAFSKLDIIGKKLWMILIMLAIMVPGQALMIPLYNTVAQLHLLNTKTALILIYATFQSPFCIYMMKSSFDSIPKDLAEAAYIDGASKLQTFSKVYMPLTISGVVTIAIFVTYTTWNDYALALIFAGSATKTFNVGFVNMSQSQFSTDWGLLTSGAYIGLLPILILFLFLQKYFVKGMMNGALK